VENKERKGKKEKEGSRPRGKWNSVLQGKLGSLEKRVNDRHAIFRKERRKEGKGREEGALLPQAKKSNRSRKNQRGFQEKEEQ